MKVIFKIIGILILFSSTNSIAQTINWNALNNSKHIITAGVGWDYSISYHLGYAQKLNSNIPIFLNASLSVPAGENIFDDFNTKIGGQFLLLNAKQMKSAVSIQTIYRRYTNPLVELNNFGSEIKGTIGFYKPKYFIGVEAAFDKAILTHFQHTEIFKEQIYAAVQDGWLQPASGGNFSYGLQMGITSRKSDIFFHIGNVITQDFISAPLIPYYLKLGYNFRL